jgi:hypothetical protein
VHLHFSDLLFELVFLYFQQYYLLLLCNTQYNERSEKVYCGVAIKDSLQCNDYGQK